MEKSYYKLNRKWLFIGFTLLHFQGNLEATPEEEIERRLTLWSQQLREKDIPAVCSLFAADLIASYPGVPDRNYHQMCEHLDKVVHDKERSFEYSSPKIESILFDKKIAVVRLIWPLQILNRQTGEKEDILEKGLDVFELQSDGTWKIKISYAYPLSQ